jgi:signal-transduction protein with cAMP-binding, CBS, and nucleotidyltransferase domain
MEGILKGWNMYTSMMTLTVNDFMAKRIESIQESASIQETAKKMKDKNASSLLVIDTSGKPIGIVTEHDIVRKHCINDVRTSEVTNREIMSSPLITIDYRLSASIAADLMLKNNVRHLLVIDEKSDDVNKPIGMITPIDFAKVGEYSRDPEDKDSIEKILEYYI